MNNTALKEKSLEHMLAKELRALDEQTEQDSETEFYLAVEQLLADTGLSAQQAARIVAATHPEVVADQNRSTMPLKVFRNPYTREVVKSRGFNHHTLNEWRKRHGRLTVQTWRIK